MFGPVKFPIILNEKKFVFQWYTRLSDETGMDLDSLLVYLRKHGADKNYNSVFTYGKFDEDSNTLVRVHSCCLTDDVFHSTKCYCGLQLNSPIELIVKNNSGAIVYLSEHEGRAIGFFAKAIPNKIQEYGLDTYQANNLINFDDDERYFEETSEIIKHFRKDKGIIILGNNPEKFRHLMNNGVKIIGTHPLMGFENNDNIQYLASKNNRTKKLLKKWNF